MGPGVLACDNEDHGEVIIEHILRRVLGQVWVGGEGGAQYRPGLQGTGQIRSGKENYLYMFFLFQLKRHIC